MLSDFKILIEQMMHDSTMEDDYQELIKKNPAIITEYIIQTISDYPSSKISDFSIILLCRLVSVLSENFISIGNQDFHENVVKSIFNFLNSSDFSLYSLSLISDLISRIILVYSNDYDTNSIFFPLIMEAIQSQNIENSQAAINTLAYCIFNESIDSQQFSNEISEFLNAVFTIEDISSDILLPSLRLLYLTFDSILLDFRSFLPNIFIQMKSNIELLNKLIHDIITYLSIERYSFFDGYSTFYILYFSEILGSEDMPNDLEYCSLEIIYNFSRAFYNDFSNNCEIIIDNIFLFLSNYENESNESKFIISKISEKYGAIYLFAVRCFNIFEEILTKCDEKSINQQIAAMNLLSYCYKGIAFVLSIELTDRLFIILIQSGVMNNPYQLIRIVSFELLSSLFKNLSRHYYTFQPMSILPEMIESIENPDDPIVLLSKFKAFNHYLYLINEDELENIYCDIQEKLLELTENSTPDLLIFIFECIEFFISHLKSTNFDIFKEFFISILEEPTTIPFSIYVMTLRTSILLTDIPGDTFKSAFSYIMELDLEIPTGKDITSLTISFQRLCSIYHSYAFSLFPLLISFSIKGATNDIEYTCFSFQELSSMMNTRASIEKQNNIIKIYDESHIQLIVFYLKVLRYSLSIRAPMIPEMIQEVAEIIYNILVKWSSFNFSDKIQYNALKIAHIFLVLTQYEFPFEPLLEHMLNFTTSESKESRLIKLYRFILQIFLDAIQNDKINDEILSSVIIFYTHELEKVHERRERICEQLISGDCGANSNKVQSLENALSMIWIPFLSNPNIDNSFFSDLIEISMSNVCITSIDFLGNYYIYKEQNPDLIEYLVNIYIAPTDEEERKNSKTPFYSHDSRCAALFLILFINDQILHPNEISFLIEIFSQRTKIFANYSLYIAIIILIADKYSDKFEISDIFSLLNRIDNLFYFDPVVDRLIVNSWNSIFPLLSQQSFEIEILARILGILLIIKDQMQDDVVETQKNILLENFQDDREELYQMVDAFIHRRESFFSDDKNEEYE